jgi:hypothetical protein
VTAPPHAGDRRGAAQDTRADHQAAPQRIPASLYSHQHVSGDGIEVGAYAPLGEGEGIFRMPVAALVVGDAEVQLAQARIDAALRLPAEAATSHASALEHHPSSHMAPIPTSTAVRISPASPMAWRLLLLF